MGSCFSYRLIVIVNSKFLKRHFKAKRGGTSLFTSAASSQKGNPKRVVRGGPSPISRGSEEAEQLLRRVSFGPRD